MRLIALIFLFLTSFLSADEHFSIYEKRKPSISQEEEFNGAYFEVGDTIDVLGKIKGNATLVGTQIVIEGDIEGNLIAIGGSVELTGKVTGNVKVLAGQATIGGEVGGRVDVISANLIMPSDGEIGGNVFLIGGYGEVSNVIDGGVLALIGGLKLSGTIEKNLRTFVGRLRVNSSADIHGTLRYRSNEKGSIDPEAKIGGGVIYTPTLFRNVMDSPLLSGLAIGSKIATFLMNFFYTFGMGILLLRFFPKKVQKTLDILHDHPVRAVICGISIVILLPVLAIILLITIVGTPFALTLMALNIIGFYTVKVFSILWVSNELLGRIGFRRNKLPILFTGQIGYYLLCLIPLAGWFVSLFFMLFGLGASVLSWGKREPVA